jgi:hypothetical protein
MDIIQTPIPSSFPPPGGYVVLASPQYGPAWVADCYGTTHEERLALVQANTKTEAGHASWRVAPRDEVAKAYAVFTS